MKVHYKALIGLSLFACLFALCWLHHREVTSRVARLTISNQGQTVRPLTLLDERPEFRAREYVRIVERLNHDK